MESRSASEDRSYYRAIENICSQKVLVIVQISEYNSSYVQEVCHELFNDHGNVSEMGDFCTEDCIIVRAGTHIWSGKKGKNMVDTG